MALTFFGICTRLSAFKFAPVLGIEKLKHCWISNALMAATTQFYFFCLIEFRNVKRIIKGAHGMEGYILFSAVIRCDHCDDFRVNQVVKNVIPIKCYLGVNDLRNIWLKNLPQTIVSEGWILTMMGNVIMNIHFNNFYFKANFYQNITKTYFMSSVGLLFSSAVMQHFPPMLSRVRQIVAPSMLSITL